MAPVLYCNRESGHSYKVALALRLMGIGFEQRPVDLNLPREQRPADFRSASLFGEVPVFVDEDGLAVCQSNAILDHIARARAMGLPHVYLGYWVNGSRKMNYKMRFMPQEHLGPKGWERYTNEAVAR